MKRNITGELAYMSNCTFVCMEDLPTKEAGQLAVCISLINEYKEKRDEYKMKIEAQKFEIEKIMSSLHRPIKNRSYVLYTEHPDWFAGLFDVDDDTESVMPDGILFSITHQHIQQRFDVSKFKKLCPETYKAYLTSVKYGPRLLTGKEIYELTQIYD